MEKKELIERLNRLLEAERAGVAVMDMLAKEESDGQIKEKLFTIRDDEGRYCAGLFGMIKERGEDPSDKTGDFIDKIFALNDGRERLALLVKGQQWVVRKVKEIPGNLLTPQEIDFIRDMVEGHEINIAYVQSLIE